MANLTMSDLLTFNRTPILQNWMYGSMLLIGISGNIIFLKSLIANSEGKSRLRPFLLNLAVGDLLVCCFTMTMEFGWRLTVIWMAGDAACRFFSFAKTFGLYLATFVVVGMSVGVLLPCEFGFPS